VKGGEKESGTIDLLIIELDIERWKIFEESAKEFSFSSAFDDIIFFSSDVKDYIIVGTGGHGESCQSIVFDSLLLDVDPWLLCSFDFVLVFVLVDGDDVDRSIGEEENSTKFLERRIQSITSVSKVQFLLSYKFISISDDKI
jgi:hypothetical protein